jgi:hypothetical protein
VFQSAFVNIDSVQAWRFFGMKGKRGTLFEAKRNVPKQRRMFRSKEGNSFPEDYPFPRIITPFDIFVLYDLR